MASRFWVGGTGTWDSSDTTHWAASSGGAGGQSVPGSADQVIFDGSSGGGTVTLNFGGTITVQQISMGSFTGTWDNSVNNNNITVSAGSGNGFSLTGTATRTIKLGSATYTLTNASGVWNFGTTNNATFTGSSATIAFTNGGTFTGGDKTYGTLSLAALTGANAYSIGGTNTFSNVSITAPCWIEFASSQTFSGAVNWAGSSGSVIALMPNSSGSQRTLAFAAGSTLQWCALRGVANTGSPTITNSFDLGNNSGASIGAPGSGAAVSFVIGS
ncbi:hypothetical protein QA649_19685 [Bradyrhizobium sp. CB1717]|uniref:hypothetical protein n=1 Tax=Bradyrhizobium sp. CB1717 TaxID=3039154 RepID=UPI0024B08B3D|nr:hypothetical protein [Bradyrhizobium sp. CB1717]WFU28353.1 hypothetical protein QA649_19685 [Bradyrhizobium sp. CB1717]